MKSKLILTASSLLFVATNAFAAVQINITAGQLLRRDGATPMMDGGLLLLVASTTDSIFTAPDSASFTPGTDDLIVARFALDSTTVGGFPGATATTLQFNYSGSFGVNDPLQLYWYPTLGSGAATPPPSSEYGFFRTDQIQDGSSISWIAPADDNNYTLRFLTSAVGGSNPNSAGIASFLTPVPEPSTYALLGLGLGGLTLATMRQRRRLRTATV